MANLPQAVEPAVLAAPPKYGLEVVAGTIQSAGDRWEDGIKWQPEQCAGGGRIALTDLCGDLATDAAATPAEAESWPFLVYAGEECSTFGSLRRDWQGRARRQLNAIRSAQIAAELWGGSLAGPGLALTDATSDTLTSGPEDPVRALGLIEAGIGHYLAGRQGMVHVTPQLLTHLAGEGAIRLVGNLWTTAMGNLVVADAGYPTAGTGPTGASANYAAQWMYGTAVVGLRVSPITFNPGTLDDNGPMMAAALDRSVNTLKLVAEQTVVIQLDPCCHVAAQVDLAPPAIGGAS